MYEIDLDNLTFEIRKSTPKHYRRAKIWVKKGKTRIVITEQERQILEKYGIKVIAVMMNHEFLHWILCSLIGEKWGLKKFDDFLERQGLYFLDIGMEMWI